MSINQRVGLGGFEGYSGCISAGQKAPQEPPELKTMIGQISLCWSGILFFSSFLSVPWGSSTNVFTKFRFRFNCRRAEFRLRYYGLYNNGFGWIEFSGKLCLSAKKIALRGGWESDAVEKLASQRLQKPFFSSVCKDNRSRTNGIGNYIHFFRTKRWNLSLRNPRN